ncbi:MAG: rhomboid family intramembrane serine protease [Halobacteria archaeon]|nr:rhomboid family intramembrane serine protease [Halobacteria archaeon]
MSRGQGRFQREGKKKEGTSDGDTSWLRLLGYVPFTVMIFAGITYVFITNGIGYETSPRIGIEVVFNPLLYIAGLFFHADMGHYWGNMLLFVPFGILMTWLTSNRHVLGIILVSHFLATVTRVGIGLSIGIISIGVGASLAVFGVMAATLVRATGIGLKNTPEQVLQAVVYLVLGLALLALFMLAIAAGNTVVDHLGHALGFLFGGAVESMYVFRKYGKDEEATDTNDYKLAHRR